MKDIEIFQEVLKSTELQDVFNISKEEIDKMDYYTLSDHKVIEIIKSIIRGEDRNSDKGSIFSIIQSKIMQL